MSKNKERKKNIIFISILTGFIILGTLLFLNVHRFENLYGFNTYVPGNHVGQSSRGETRQAERITDKQRKEFEALINGMLKEVFTRTRDYRNKRKVITELVKPDSIREPGFIVENKAQMDAIVPSLKSHITRVLNVFDRADSSFTDWLQTIPRSLRKSMLQRWDAMRTNQLDMFIQFFQLEQSIIDLHVKLMDLYIINKDTLQVYVVGDKIIFQSPEDQRLHQVLLQQIQGLQARQNQIFERAQ